MLESASTLPSSINQAPTKQTICSTCGAVVYFKSKTLPPRFCRSCRAERQRTSDRIAAEKKRRKRGVIPLKGVMTPCAKCGTEFRRSNIKHIYCAPCGEENYRQRTRKASRDKNATAEGRAAANEWWRKRYHSDPAWRISAHMRALMHRSLRTKKQGRSWRTLVPYSLVDLMAHLESQFLPGMTWENCGQWHIDHKIPRKHFKFSSENDAEFKAAWALSNLQPLWAIDNIRKGASLPAEMMGHSSDD